MSFKPSNDIIILLCKFPTTFCRLKSYPIIIYLKLSDIYSLATYIHKQHMMLNGIMCGTT